MRIDLGSHARALRLVGQTTRERAPPLLGPGPGRQSQVSTAWQARMMPSIDYRRGRLSRSRNPRLIWAHSSARSPRRERSAAETGSVASFVLSLASNGTDSTDRPGLWTVLDISFNPARRHSTLSRAATELSCLNVLQSWRIGSSVEIGSVQPSGGAVHARSGSGRSIQRIRGITGRIQASPSTM